MGHLPELLESDSDHEGWGEVEVEVVAPQRQQRE